VDRAFATLADWSLALQRGEVSSADIVRLYLRRIDELDDKLHAYVHVDAARALHDAGQSDRRRARRQTRGPLDGVPIAVKDLFDIEGEVTTCGSQAWRERRGTGTADVVRRVLDAGMVILGKTHMVEFAFGLWGTNPVMGTPWNPWDLQRHRVPGGSSSGSAVAVAAGLAPAALGSDTGGSVRVPAALNGLTGLKPTWGRISLRHALPLSATLDSAGPICRSVQDAAWLFDVLADDGRGPAAPMPLPEDDVRGMRVVAIAPEDSPAPLHPDVERACDEARRGLASLGVEVVERRCPFDFAELTARNGTLTAAEAWRVHRAHVEDPSLPIGEFVRRRVLGGKAVSDEALAQAIADHRRASAQWKAWLADADAFITPATPMPASLLNEVDESIAPLGAFSRPGNYLGACGLALPAGFSADGLPIGMQLLGRPDDEAALLRLGAAWQRHTDWHRRTPAL
jgi:aspartyl-tRNA(Asn)/glutamyl-tRNA(Gln) amidotransferase subunit A